MTGRMRPSAEPGLTIAQLAARAGVAPGTLRMWESRHGFPRPSRTSSGQRRYSTSDVERVHRVAEDRAAGMSLKLAIQRAAERPVGAETTLFAELRQRHPDLDTHVLSKRAMTALSHAIEDECCARARRPLLYGSFQRERFYRLAQPRWRELSRAAEAAVVFADFPALAHPTHAPTEIPLAASSSLLREWSVVCDAPGYGACLIGCERLHARPVRDADRAYEVVWSVEPGVVRSAALIADARVRLSVTVPRRAAARLAEAPDAIGSAQMRVAAALTSRMAAYLGACAPSHDPDTASEREGARP